MCVPGAARSRRSLASGFSEVLTSELCTGFLPVKYIFAVANPMKTNISVHFFSP